MIEYTTTFIKAPRCGCGDLDGDGVITPYDAELASYYRGTVGIDPDTLRRGDLNRNGVIDDEDVAQIERLATQATSVITIRGTPYTLSAVEAVVTRECPCSSIVPVLSPLMALIGVGALVYGVRRSS